MTAPFPKSIRMWHKKINGDFCHAWDVEEKAYDLWKQGGSPLSSAAVLLPTNKNPAPGTRVVCGTCFSPDIIPSEMKTELHTNSER